MKIQNYLFLSIIYVVIFSSCKEDNINESGTICSQDYLFAENLFNDINRIVEEAFIYNGELKSCPEYTLMNQDTSNTDTIIIDFGDGDPDDCLLYRKERRGKIIITFSGKYRDSLSIIRTTFDHYYTNNNWIQGEYIITNHGKNQQGNIMFSNEVIGGSITTNHGTINYNSNMLKEWISGSNTFSDIYDDKYVMNGTAYGNSSNDQDFEVTIVEDLYIDQTCFTENYCIISSGNIELTPLGYTKRYLEYGDTTCDCNVKMNLNNSEYSLVINN